MNLVVRQMVWKVWTRPYRESRADCVLYCVYRLLGEGDLYLDLSLRWQLVLPIEIGDGHLTMNELLFPSASVMA